MKQKAKGAGYGLLGRNNDRLPNSRDSDEESTVIPLVTATRPCAVCGKGTHGWGTVEGGYVCGEACHKEFNRRKNEEMENLSKTRKVGLIFGADGILRPANLPTKNGS